MNHKPKLSYIICSTPRTGSTLLCSLLKSTQIAGLPESFFRQQDLNKWVEKWGIKNNGSYEFLDFLNATLQAGTTDNGVFGMRVMWGTMEEITSNLRKTFPSIKGTDKEILLHVLGDTKFLYLQRSDRIAQAVSLVRALQSDIWHITSHEDRNSPSPNLQYDFEQIHKLVLEANDHNNEWKEWFKFNQIEPHIINYEGLDENPQKTIQDLLNFLGLELSDYTKIEAPNKRLADKTNKEWCARYQQDLEKLES